MKITDKIVSKFGADKLLHFSIAGWITSLSGYFNITMMICTSVILIIISIAKEIKFDNYADWGDFKAALVGIMISWIVYFV